MSIAKKKKTIKYLQIKYRQASKEIIQNNKIVFIPEMQGWFNIFRSMNVISYKIRLKGKNHIAISIDTEKGLDKTNIP